MEPDENPTLMYSIYRETDAQFVLFVTKNGIVKKTALDEYVNTKKKTGIAAIKLKDGDSLASVNLIKDEDIVVITRDGMGIRFNSMDIGATGRDTSGVKCMALKEGDTIASALVVRHKEDQVAIFAESGLGKKFALSELVTQKRGGKGLIVYKDTIAAAALVSDEDSILIIGDKTGVCISAQEIPLMGRGSLGNQLIKGSKIKSVTKV